MSISEHYAALGLVAVLAILVVVGSNDHQEAVLAEAHYCKMVKLFNDTGGENGWPDYKENYLEACK